MKNFEAYCRTFYVSHFLPIAYYENGEELCAVGFPEGIPTYQAVLRILLAAPQNPAVYSMPDMELYGIIRLNDSGGYLVLGPAYSSNISDEVVRIYMSRAKFGNSFAPFHISPTTVLFIFCFICTLS